MLTLRAALMLCAVILAGSLLAGCDSEEEPLVIELPRPTVVNDTAYTTTASGLRYIDLVPGDTPFPAAKDGQQVVLDYNAWLETGALFESTIFFGARPPISYIIGDSTVIPGFDEGMRGMRHGGLRQLVIPPELAYHSVGVGDVIPPKATLTYEIDYIGFVPGKQ